MKSSKILLAAAVAALGVQSAEAADGVDMGVLTCKLTGTTNLVVYTDEEFDCVFDPKTGNPYTYTGQIKSVGVDLSITKELTMVWAVLTTKTDGDVANQLRGTYLGAGASVEVVGGVGLNALVGGNSKAITLQPVSVSGSVGAGASIGLERFELR
ncbi:DUF992 domain-containing protein [Acuticoccus sp. MNP-M23]|uniref:DUF992 domain-containing protein n=1 Tax=Acuticoccus sp. MNP-M23 TaxID=3072793 RepID=UPI00281521DD|nr:DUF992 domain-containing protein [Acuticoccus sp. MNP-M23]WMS40777.1 DUF992 domain-containing protein [Acuticoccus sp. MNP-M23]